MAPLAKIPGSTAHILSQGFGTEHWLIGVTILCVVIFGAFPDLWTWVGTAIIIGSGLYVPYLERRPERRAVAVEKEPR